MVVVKNGILQSSFHVDKLFDMDLTIKMEKDRLNVITSSSEYGRQVEAVRICLTFQYGFVLVVGDSDVYYFRKTDEGRRFDTKRVHSYKRM